MGSSPITRTNYCLHVSDSLRPCESLNIWLSSKKNKKFTKKQEDVLFFYCIGKIDFFLDISVSLTIFSIQQG